MREAAHFRLPVLEEVVLLLERFEAATLQGRSLGVSDRVLDGALAVRVADPGGVGDHAVVRQRGRIDGVELGFVQVRLEDAFLQVVEDHVAAAASKIPPGPLVQLGPGLLTRLPHYAAEASP
jgi:hypothetical protein